MGMRHNQPRKLLAPGSNKAEIRHLHRGSQRTRHLLQSNATVHGDPLVSMAKQIKVHTDLPAPPQGQEDHIATERIVHSNLIYQV